MAYDSVSDLKEIISRVGIALQEFIVRAYGCMWGSKIKSDTLQYLPQNLSPLNII